MKGMFLAIPTSIDVAHPNRLQTYGSHVAVQMTRERCKGRGQAYQHGGQRELQLPVVMVEGGPTDGGTEHVAKA